MVGDGEIFAAGSFVLCCHDLNICRQEAAGPCSPWQGEVRLQRGTVCLHTAREWQATRAFGTILHQALLV